VTNIWVLHKARDFVITLGSQWKLPQFLTHLFTMPRYSFRVLCPRHPPPNVYCSLYSCTFCLRFCIVIGVEVGTCAIRVQTARRSRRPVEILNIRVFVVSLTRAEMLDRCQKEPCPIECIKFLNFVLCYLCHILFSHILFSIFTWLDFRRLIYLAMGLGICYEGDLTGLCSTARPL
jgi:hypothetical protein